MSTRFSQYPVDNGERVEEFMTQYGRRVPSIRDRLPPVGTMVRPEYLNRVPTPLSADMSPEEARHIPQSTYDPSIYADVIDTLINVPAGQSVLALQRPSNTRILLMVQSNAAVPLYIGWGKQADLTSMFIPAGSGVLTLDAKVPQNDLYMFATVAVVIPIWYMNADISASRR